MKGLKAFQLLEEKFGTPHPALDGFKEPHRFHGWLVESFFRLHRRRMSSESGFQPISFLDMAALADQVLRLPEDLRSLFFRTMEITDNIVLHDHYVGQREAINNLPKPKSKRNRGK